MPGRRAQAPRTAPRLLGVDVKDAPTARALNAQREAILVLQRKTDSETTEVFDDDSDGLTPASGGGTTTFLRADGTWAVPPGSGGVADGDKGDITVSAGGTAWNLDAGVVAATELASDAVTTAKILDANVTLAKLVDIATASFLGRTTGGTGDVEVLTATQATALLNLFSSTLKGLVPLSGGGTTNFLRADGTWAVPVWTDSGYFGDGSDGDVTISSGTTTLTKTMYYNNLTIASGATLKSGGFSIHVKGTLTFADSTATISRAGNNGTDAVASPQSAGAGGAGLTGGFTPTSGAGANGTISSSASSSAVTGVYQGCVATGGTGGTGNFHGGSAAGGLGTPIAVANGDVRQLPQSASARTHNNTAITSTSTGGGGGGASQFSNQSASGGAGGGGGWLIVCAKSIVHTTGTGVLTAAGGAAGASVAIAANCGAGGSGGGGGGVVVLVYHDGTLPTVSVAGGAGALAVTNSSPAPSTPTNGTAGGAGIQLVFQV